MTVGDVSEADLVWDLARRLEGRMLATGMEALLSRGRDQVPARSAERARFANEAGADLFLSLHIDANASPLARVWRASTSAPATAHTSTVGEALAGFIQRELVARTGHARLPHPRPRTWDIPAADPLPGGPDRGRLPHQRLGPRRS